MPHPQPTYPCSYSYKYPSCTFALTPALFSPHPFYVPTTASPLASATMDCPCPAFCSPFPVSTELMSQGEETSPHVQSQEKDSRRTLTDLAPKYPCPASLYFLPYPSPKKDEKLWSQPKSGWHSGWHCCKLVHSILMTMKSPPNIDLQSECTTNRQSFTKFHKATN